MKWRQGLKKVMGFVLAGIFAVGMMGCQGGQEEEEILTVCVDSANESIGSMIADGWSNLDDGVKTELVVIPSDETAAQAKIKELRTEIMSGGGPDVFLFSTDGNQRLFEDPKKAMYSDTFLPLDDYMSDAKYMKPEEWNQAVLESGRTEEGQVVLPVLYSYYAFAFQTSCLENPGEIPSSLEKFLACEDPLIGSDVASFSHLAMLYSFGELADYQEEKLFFSEEDLLKRVEEILDYKIKWPLKWSLDTEVEGVVAHGEVDGTFFSNVDRFPGEEETVFAFPNDQGGVTARVKMYAAINRNTELPEQAFAALDFLLSNEVISGEGFPYGEDKWAGRGNWFSPALGGISVNQTLTQEACRSQTAKDALKKMNSQITAVRYPSILDQEIQQTYLEAGLNASGPHPDEAARKDLVSRAYERMEMQLSE